MYTTMTTTKVFLSYSGGYKELLFPIGYQCVIPRKNEEVRIEYDYYTVRDIRHAYYLEEGIQEVYIILEKDTQ